MIPAGGLLVGALLLLLGNAWMGRAQEGLFHGFAQINYSVRVGPDGPETDFLLGDERFQLELSRSSDSGNAGLALKADLYRDAVDHRAGLDLRETYLTLGSRRADLRLGRQVITWGVGDLVFISDVFPKDWTALLSGRPLQYLKVGSDAASLNLYLTALSAQVILIPFFEPDVLPQGRRLLAFDPFPGVPRRELRPEGRLKNAELAIRLYRYLGAFDVALYAYRGFWRSPPGMRLSGEEVRLFYPELSVYGASLQGNCLNGVLSLEGGVYDSLQDQAGKDAAVENGQVRLLLGYQRAWGDELTTGLQYYGEWMRQYRAYAQSLGPGSPQRQELRHSATFRITRFFRYQTVRLSLFAWASPNEEDYYLNPELRYSASDEMWIAVGGNLFGGAEGHTFLGQFDPNDNMYLTLRYGF
jgi:hypothetical protein